MPRRLRTFLLALLVCTALPVWAEAPTAAPLFAAAAVDVDGKPFALDGLQGKPLLVNFWARWCGPCRKEIPDLVEMNAKYRGRGLVIVGLAVEENDSREAVRDFALAYEVDYSVPLVGVGKGVELMKALGNDRAGLPFTIVVDRQGRIVAKKLGAMSKTEMEAAIKQIL